MIDNFVFDRIALIGFECGTHGFVILHRIIALCREECDVALSLAKLRYRKDLVVNPVVI